MPTDYAKYYRVVLQLERVVRDLEYSDPVLLADTIEALKLLIGYNQELMDNWVEDFKNER